MIPNLFSSKTLEEKNTKKLDEERNRKFPSGKNKVFKNRVGWAVAYLRKAVLIKRLRKGASDITERAKEVLGQEP